MNQIELGKFIYKLRIEANLTQDELAEKIGVSSGKIISKWETGYNMPDFISLKKLSIALNVTLYELSECRRLEKKKHIDATKDFIKKSSDIFKLNIFSKVTIVITILLGIFFGLCAIFTLGNYGTVEVYTIESLNPDFYINGNFILTSEFNVFNLIDIEYIGDDDTLFNTKVYNVGYEIINQDMVTIISYSTLKNNEKAINYTSLSENLNQAHFNLPLTKKKKTEVAFKNNAIFTFTISYEDNNKKINIIEFPFKIIRKYKNIF